PIPTDPPRVEIILPTGGKKQADAEKDRWRRLLADAAQKFPVEGQSEPYKDVKRGGDEGGRAVLIDRIVERAKADRAKAEEWVDGQLPKKATERKTLTGDEVEQIKNLIARQGHLDFRILANTTDDKEAIDAAQKYYTLPSVKPQIVKA